MTQFYSNGKLLLTAEYLVIDGALALALPSKYGQDLSVKPIEEPLCIWESFDADKNMWFKAEFELPALSLNSAKSSIEKATFLKLQSILLEARKLNSNFLSTNQGYHIQTRLSFPRLWGLGTSSTLINNVAQWAKIDAFKLQLNTFGGSAYDIACAQNNKPVLYQLKLQKPIVKQISFEPIFKDQLYFVYLNKKQNSREGIEKYNLLKGNVGQPIQDITSITKAIAFEQTLDGFEKLMIEHENIISKLIKTTPIQESVFKDYFGQIKSLGAWGGDFILATGNNDTPVYFKNKGFKTVIPYRDIVL